MDFSNPGLINFGSFEVSAQVIFSGGYALVEDHIADQYALSLFLGRKILQDPNRILIGSYRILP